MEHGRDLEEVETRNQRLFMPRGELDIMAFFLGEGFDGDAKVNTR